MKYRNSLYCVALLLFGAIGGIAADSTAGILDKETRVPIGGALGAISVAIGAAWWLGVKFTKFEANLNSLRAEIRNLPCRERGKCDL